MVKIILIGLWFFLIPWFASVNFLLKLIVLNTFGLSRSVLYIFTRVLCVCVCVCVCERERERERERECVCVCVHIYLFYPCTHIFSGLLFFPFSLFLPELNVREPVYAYMFALVSLCMKFDSICMHACVYVGEVLFNVNLNLSTSIFSFIWNNLSSSLLTFFERFHYCILKGVLKHRVFYFLVI